jgi:two-component system OmpR family response regulator
MCRADGNPINVLVVDDESVLAEMVSMALRYEGWNIATAGDGSSAIASARAQRPDVVVLDVMLPDMSGLDVLHKLREENPQLPVLLLTAKDAVEDRIAGLTAGGDDYVTKPFSPRELVARVNVILRRITSRGMDSQTASTTLAHGSLSIDPEQHVAAFAGTPLRLTAIEFGILRTFLARPAAVFSREQIMSAAYQLNIQVSDRTIDSHIRNIRAKLAALNCDNVIETIHGVGFRLGRCEPQA